MNPTLATVVRNHAVERPIPCDIERWASSLERHGFPGALPDELADRVVRHGDTITREMVFDYQDADATALLVAAMLWGFGPLGYGPYRVAQMLQGRRGGGAVSDVIDDIRTVARTDPAAGFAALFSSGRTRVPQLGIAMGTKLLYFSAGRRGDSTMPLVLDQVVYAACRRLGLDAPDPRRYTSAVSYAAYCNDMADRAARLGIAADTLEMSLFNWQQQY